MKEVEAGLGEDLAPLPTSSDQRTLRSPLSKRVTKELAQVSLTFGRTARHESVRLVSLPPT